MHCKICGIELVETKNFCPNCGTRITTEEISIICNKCGTKLHEKQIYCPLCGEKTVEPSGLFYDFLKILKGTVIVFLLILSFTAYGIPLLIGLILWIIIGKLATNSWVVSFIYKLIKRFVVSTKLTRKRGELIWREKQLKAFTWKQIFWNEGFRRSLLPIAMIFGIINLFHKQLEIYDWLFFNTELTSSVEALFLFSPCLTIIFPIIWLLSDSNWLIFDETRHNITRVGDQIISLIKGVAGTGAIVGVVIKLIELKIEPYLIIAAMMFLFFVTAPQYLTTVLYLKLFHPRFTQKF